jgi:hypothetical protein
MVTWWCDDISSWEEKFFAFSNVASRKYEYIKNMFSHTVIQICSREHLQKASRMSFLLKNKWPKWLYYTGIISSRHRPGPISPTNHPNSYNHPTNMAQTTSILAQASPSKKWCIHFNFLIWQTWCLYKYNSEFLYPISVLSRSYFSSVGCQVFN